MDLISRVYYREWAISADISFSVQTGKKLNFFMLRNWKILRNIQNVSVTTYFSFYF